MADNFYSLDGELKSDGTLKLDSLPPFPPGRVRVTLQAIPLSTDDDDLNWPDLDYASVPLQESESLTIRVQHDGDLQPMPHDLDRE